jgi:hypothetical protein
MMTGHELTRRRRQIRHRIRVVLAQRRLAAPFLPTDPSAGGQPSPEGVDPGTDLVDLDPLIPGVGEVGIARPKVEGGHPQRCEA